MNEINERIEWLKKAIKVLSDWNPTSHMDKLNRIINISEYKQELETLEKAQRYLNEKPVVSLD